METTTQKKYIKYRRVSTDHQGDSGLGLANQDAQLDRYIKNHDGILVGEFFDVSTGKNEKRAGLKNALKMCKQHGATLLVWDLARASRRRLFIEELLSSDTDFVVVSQPHATKLLLRLLADFDAHEVEQISARTKAGLAVLKQRVERGESWISKSGAVCNKIGNASNFTDDYRRKGAQAVRAAAMENENNRKAALYAKSLKDAGFTLKQICEKLEEGGFKTATGGKFHTTSIHRVLSRYENKTAV